MKKEIPRRGYRVLAIVWTLAAAAMAVAVVRRLAEFNLFLLALLILSTLTAASFWRTYHNTPEEAGTGPFDAPPKFADDPMLFDDDPPPIGSQLFTDSDPDLTTTPNKDSEEKDHE